MKNWISAFRLRTLPLALSCIITGTALAIQQHKFNWLILSLCISTTILFQILSNLANDLGDSLKGTDNENRIGPERAVQSGAISTKEMKMGVIITTILSILSGGSLIYYGTSGISLGYTWIFITLGIASIAAAIKYTVGKSAYGYSGLGDVFVFIFFGLVGVLGSNFLFTHHFQTSNILPAITIGFLSTAVLNLNNMRDHVNDRASKKNTLVVKLGLLKAKKYHITIILISMLSTIVHTFLIEFKATSFIYLISYIPLVKHIVFVLKNNEEKAFDPELKKVALSTFLFSILFLVGAVL